MVSQVCVAFLTVIIHRTWFAHVHERKEKHHPKPDLQWFAIRPAHKELKDCQSIVEVDSE